MFTAGIGFVASGANTFERASTIAKPSLVTEVSSRNGRARAKLRQPVYLGLRTDKRAKDVVRESNSHGNTRPQPPRSGKERIHALAP
jgi:hypothetical protein